MNKVAEILRISGYKRLNAKQPLAKALAHLQSSHDVVFIFKKQQFLGIINLYYSLLRRRPSSNELVERALYHPPLLTPATSLTEAARLMAESRLYQLPVIREGKFQGVVTARDILRQLAKAPEMSFPLSTAITLRPAVFINKTATVSQARHLMLQKRTSRLIVTGRNKRPEGIMSSYDLRRTSKQLTTIGSRPKLKRTVAIGQRQIANFFHRGLVTISDDQSAGQALHRLLKAPVGSLAVISTSNQQITGLISYRDFLKRLSRHQGKPRWLFSFRLTLPYEEKFRLQNYIRRLFQRQQIFQNKINRLNLILSHQNHHSGRSTYKITAQVRASNHHDFTLINQGRYLTVTLQKLARQLRRRLNRQI